MIFNTDQKNQTRNLPNFDSIKNYSSLVNKTRVESLNERIHKANEFINFFVEKKITEKKEKIDKKEEISKPEVNTQEINKTEINNIVNTTTINTNKSVQVDENNIINNENKESNLDNINNTETKNENNNIENKIENIEDNKKNNDENVNKDNKNDNETKINIENNKKQKNEENNNETEENIDIPFMRKIKTLLFEIKKLKEKSIIKEEDINNEITNELPKRSLIEISLSDIKSKRNNESLNKKLIEKEKYIKELESELFKERNENIKLKKSENEYLLKISALEDELRVFKSKFIKYYSKTENNSPQEYGEKLVRSMWIRDNIIENKNNLINNNINNDTNSINNNTNSNMTFNNNNLRNNNRNSFYKNKWNSPWNSQSQRNINNNEFINNNFRYNNGGLNNFQRVSGMILDNNKNNIRNRLFNYGNDINRFRNGNYFNNNNF